MKLTVTFRNYHAAIFKQSAAWLWPMIKGEIHTLDRFMTALNNFLLIFYKSFRHTISVVATPEIDLLDCRETLSAFIGKSPATADKHGIEHSRVLLQSLSMKQRGWSIRTVELSSITVWKNLFT